MNKLYCLWRRVPNTVSRYTVLKNLEPPMTSFSAKGVRGTDQMRVFCGTMRRHHQLKFVFLVLGNWKAKIKGWFLCGLWGDDPVLASLRSLWAAVFLSTPRSHCSSSVSERVTPCQDTSCIDEAHPAEPIWAWFHGSGRCVQMKSHSEVLGFRIPGSES